MFGGCPIDKIKSLTELAGVVTELPRGGYLVDTSEGYVQFGAPPETLKDTKLLPKSVPTIFFLPFDHFNPSQGISLAEVEFPIYFNFFILKKKMKVFVNPDHIENMKIVLNEAAFGPRHIDISNEIDNPEGYPAPNLKAEMEYFRGGNTLENMVDFYPILPQGNTIGNVKVVQMEDKSFVIFDKGDKIAEIPAKIEFQIRYDLGSLMKEPFEPPEFGITCLGPSHGFDHEQNTSGFILWINKTGVMIDPPVNSTAWLRDSNVNPKQIDSLILTHCHADHDSGTFQKILEESRITLYTTPTILDSFLRKYSALTRMPCSTLMNMFDFVPLKINMEYNIHGAIFNFFYSLHSIPTIAFHMFYRNKTFLYSSDHMNNPVKIREMMQVKAVSRERGEFLLGFPWDMDIIYHEAGVPPLHTPVTYLNSLPKDVQKKITVYHIAEKDFPKDTNLRLAKFGIGETVYPDIEKHEYEEAYEILDVFSRIDIFNSLPQARIKDLLLIVETEHFEKGQKIIEMGTEGDKFYVIVSGTVSIGGVENVSDKVYGTYEYFGEASLLLGGLRSADVVAETSVMAYSIRKDSFLRLIRHTEVEKQILQLAAVRSGQTWNVIKSNRFFKDLSSSQVTQLESMITNYKLKKNSVLYRRRADREFVYILASGDMVETKNNRKHHALSRGDFIYDHFDFEEENGRGKNYLSESECELYRINKQDYIEFLNHNPGIKMKLMYSKRK